MFFEKKKFDTITTFMVIFQGSLVKTVFNVRSGCGSFSIGIAMNCKKCRLFISIYFFSFFLFPVVEREKGEEGRDGKSHQDNDGVKILQRIITHTASLRCIIGLSVNVFKHSADSSYVQTEID